MYDPPPLTAANPVKYNLEAGCNSIPYNKRIMHISESRLASGYQFVALDELPLKRARILARARSLGLAGTVLIAPEGINFSLAGAPGALDDWLDWAAGHLDMDQPVINRQRVGEPPFLRLKVRIRLEIISFDQRLDPAQTGAEALDPEAFERLLEGDAVQLVDARNRYEVALGRFEGALDPATDNFSEFRDWARTRLDPVRPVAMYCTGGVRCEKAGAWLKARGFERVYQLEGGILRYLEKIPEHRSRWRGECFVFDDRVSVDHRLQPAGRSMCGGCRRPAQGPDASGMPPIDVNGACQACGRQFDPARQRALRERTRQIELARQRGDRHLGPQ